MVVHVALYSQMRGSIWRRIITKEEWKGVLCRRGVLMAVTSSRISVWGYEGGSVRQEKYSHEDK